MDGRPRSIARRGIVERAKRALARQQRREPTASERLAWSLLRARRCLGLKWRRQQVIGPFIVDFYCAELRLALEVDGGVHSDPDRVAYDRERDALLRTRGVDVLRVRDVDVSADHLRRLLELRGAR